MEYNVKGLNNLSKQLNRFVKKAGFDGNDIPTRMILIHSEISEAFEAWRKEKFSTANHVEKANGFDFEGNRYAKEAFENSIKDSFEDELADSLIRLLDLCGKMDVDIEYHVTQKMKYNETRGYKYGGKKC